MRAKQSGQGQRARARARAKNKGKGQTTNKYFPEPKTQAVCCEDRSCCIEDYTCLPAPGGCGLTRRNNSDNSVSRHFFPTVIYQIVWFPGPRMAPEDPSSKSLPCTYFAMNDEFMLRLVLWIWCLNTQTLLVSFMTYYVRLVMWAVDTYREPKFEKKILKKQFLDKQIKKKKYFFHLPK